MLYMEKRYTNTCGLHDIGTTNFLTLGKGNHNKHYLDKSNAYIQFMNYDLIHI